jgi:hypothetical protein
MSSNQNEEDNMITLILLFCGVGGFGLFSASALLAPVQVWMMQQGILVSGSSVLLGWGKDHVGLDIARVIVAAGVVLILLVIIFAVLRGRWARRDV